MFSFNSVKSSTHKKCFQSFLHFFKLFVSLFSRLCSVLYKISLEVTCLQNPGRWNISELCLFLNWHVYWFMCFTACLQLVKVSTVYVFLGRDLLVQESESQEIRYLFEICSVEHSAHNCHQIAISHVYSFSMPVYSLSQQKISKLCCIWLEVTC